MRLLGLGLLGLRLLHGLILFLFGNGFFFLNGNNDFFGRSFGFFGILGLFRFFRYRLGLWSKLLLLLGGIAYITAALIRFKKFTKAFGLFFFALLLLFRAFLLKEPAFKPPCGLERSSCLGIQSVDLRKQLLCLIFNSFGFFDHF